MNNKPAVLSVIILLLLTAGCLSNKQPKISEVSYSGLGSKDSLTPVLSQDRGTGDVEGNTISLDRKIISTAHLQLEVESIHDAFNEITNITLAQGGFISGSSIYGGEHKSGQVTVRIPQKNFYSALEQIEALGTVRSRQIQGQDVTEEFIDLEARLGNLKKQEMRLQEILKMATTVKDVLEVEHELERVRGEIERLTGRLNYLNQSVEMSTINVNAAEPAPFTGESWGITEALGQAVRGFIESIKGLIVFTGFILPILVYIILVIMIVLGIKKKVLPRLPRK